MKWVKHNLHQRRSLAQHFLIGMRIRWAYVSLCRQIYRWHPNDMKSFINKKLLIDLVSRLIAKLNEQTNRDTTDFKANSWLATAENKNV